MQASDNGDTPRRTGFSHMPMAILQRTLAKIETFGPWNDLWRKYWLPKVKPGERIVRQDLRERPWPGDSAPRSVRARWHLMNGAYKMTPGLHMPGTRDLWEEFTAAQAAEQDPPAASISTMAAYNAGKALYPREKIIAMEKQLMSSIRKPRGLSKMFHGMDAPKTDYVMIADYDEVNQHYPVWRKDAMHDLGVGELVRFGASEIEFRTIQELGMPDRNYLDEVYSPHPKYPSVAYSAIHPVYRWAANELHQFHESLADEMDLDDALEELKNHCEELDKSPEWAHITTAVRNSLVYRSIDKIVFFFSSGLAYEDDYCMRARYLLALAIRLRDQILASRDGSESTSGVIPIYMPAHDIDSRWSQADREILQRAGVVPIERNAELVLKMNAHSVVISYRHWNPVKQLVADLARPAILICKPAVPRWTDFGARVERTQRGRHRGELVWVPLVRHRAVDDSIVGTDPDSPRVRDMLRDYAELPLPELPGDQRAPEDMGCYLRRVDAELEPPYRGFSEAEVAMTFGQQ